METAKIQNTPAIRQTVMDNVKNFRKQIVENTKNPQGEKNNAVNVDPLKGKSLDVKA